MNDPVKCPDCSTWWRGDEHRCGQPEWFEKVMEAIRALPHSTPCTRPHADGWYQPHPWWQYPSITYTPGTVTTTAKYIDLNSNTVTLDGTEQITYTGGIS